MKSALLVDQRATERITVLKQYQNETKTINVKKSLGLFVKGTDKVSLQQYKQVNMCFITLGLCLH